MQFAQEEHTHAIQGVLYYVNHLVPHSAVNFGKTARLDAERPLHLRVGRQQLHTVEALHIRQPRQ